ncbi:MAG TPA: hypothetical protein VMI56_28175 [Reyranella sp.]|nr:hypothetical protein [Reyranella sp.]
MPRSRAVLLSLALLAAPLPALAQAGDAEYCAALTALANRYLTGGSANGAGTQDLDTRSAMADCAAGKFSSGIPVLEKKLRSNGFSLPKRS